MSDHSGIFFNLSRISVLLSCHDSLDSRREFKASASQFLSRADALVTVRPEFKPRVWPGMSFSMLEDKPIFPVSAGEWSNPALSRFVRERLASAGEQEILWIYHA